MGTQACFALTNSASRGERTSLDPEYVTAMSSRNAKDSWMERNKATSEGRDTVEDSTKELVGRPHGWLCVLGQGSHSRLQKCDLKVPR